MDFRPTIKALRAELQRIDQAILAFEQIVADHRPKRGRPRKVPSFSTPEADSKPDAKSLNAGEES